MRMVYRVVVVSLLGIASVVGSGCAGSPSVDDPTANARVLGPEGQGRIAFLRNDGTYWQVWTLDLESGQERQLTRSQTEKARISWYPDGESVFVNTLDGRIFEVDLRTGAEKPISASLPGARDAVLSPDGSRIAVSLVMSEVLDTNEIHILEANGENVRKLVRIREFQHEPQWSAEGDAIYFLSVSRGNLDHDIWRASLDGLSLERLTAGNAYHLDLATAMGGKLAFSNNRTGDYEIWTWEPGTGEPAVRMTESPGLDGGPTWGPGGKSIVFHSTRTGSLQLWALVLSDGSLVQLTDDSRPSRGPVWWWP